MLEILNCNGTKGRDSVMVSSPDLQSKVLGLGSTSGNTVHARGSPNL